MSSVTRVDVIHGSVNSNRMLLIAEHHRLTEIVSSASQSLLSKPIEEQKMFSWVNHAITILNQGTTLSWVPASALKLQAQVTFLAQSTLDAIACTEQWTDAQIQTLLQFCQAASRSYYPDIFGPRFMQLVELRSSAVRDYDRLWDLHAEIMSGNSLEAFLTCCSKPFLDVYCNPSLSISEKDKLSGDLFEAILIKEQLDVLPPLSEQDFNKLDLRLATWSESYAKCKSFDIINGYLKTRLHLAKWELLDKKNGADITKQSLLEFMASFVQDPQFQILNDLMNQVRITLFQKVEMREWIEVFRKGEQTVRESFPSFLRGETRPTTGFNQWDFDTFYKSLPQSKEKDALTEARDSHLASLTELNRFLSKYRSLKRKPISEITKEDLAALDKCRAGIYGALMVEPTDNLKAEVQQHEQDILRTQQDIRSADSQYRTNQEIEKAQQDFKSLKQAIAACQTEEDALALQTRLNLIDTNFVRLSKLPPYPNMKKELNTTREHIDALIEIFHKKNEAL